MDYENLMSVKPSKKKKHSIWFIVLNNPLNCWVTLNKKYFGIYFEKGKKFLSLDGIDAILNKDKEFHISPDGTCCFCNKVSSHKNGFTYGVNNIYLHKECALELKSIINSKMPEKLKPKLIAKSV